MSGVLYYAIDHFTEIIILVTVVAVAMHRPARDLPASVPRFVRVLPGVELDPRIVMSTETGKDNLADVRKSMTGICALMSTVVPLEDRKYFLDYLHCASAVNQTGADSVFYRAILQYVQARTADELTVNRQLAMFGASRVKDGTVDVEAKYDTPLFPPLTEQNFLSEMEPLLARYGQDHTLEERARKKLLSWQTAVGKGFDKVFHYANAFIPMLVAHKYQVVLHIPEVMKRYKDLVKAGVDRNPFYGAVYNAMSFAGSAVATGYTGWGSALVTGLAGNTGYGAAVNETCKSLFYSAMYGLADNMLTGYGRTLGIPSFSFDTAKADKFFMTYRAINRLNEQAVPADYAALSADFYNNKNLDPLWIVARVFESMGILDLGPKRDPQGKLYTEEQMWHERERKVTYATDMYMNQFLLVASPLTTAARGLQLMTKSDAPISEAAADKIAETITGSTGVVSKFMRTCMYASDTHYVKSEDMFFQPLIAKLGMSSAQIDQFYKTGRWFLNTDASGGFTRSLASLGIVSGILVQNNKETLENVKFTDVGEAGSSALLRNFDEKSKMALLFRSYLATGSLGIRVEQKIADLEKLVKNKTKEEIDVEALSGKASEILKAAEDVSNAIRVRVSRYDMSTAENVQKAFDQNMKVATDALGTDLLTKDVNDPGLNKAQKLALLIKKIADEEPKANQQVSPSALETWGGLVLNSKDFSDIAKDESIKDNPQLVQTNRLCAVGSLGVFALAKTIDDPQLARDVITGKSPMPAFWTETQRQVGQQLKEMNYFETCSSHNVLGIVDTVTGSKVAPLSSGEGWWPYIGRAASEAWNAVYDAGSDTITGATRDPNVQTQAGVGATILKSGVNAASAVAQSVHDRVVGSFFGS